MKFIFLCCTFLGASLFSFSQNELKGVIIDQSTGESIAFATVLNQKSKRAGVSALNGEFSVPANIGDTLRVSSLSYITQIFHVQSLEDVEIQLEASSKNMDEVVIVALGLKRSKRDLGYAVQKVDSKELTEVRTPNLINNLAGKVAGIQTTQGSSGVGSSSRIIIRGESSLSGNNQPLFVVDGVPVSNDFIANNTENLENDFQEVDYGNGIGDFSADDIESISVLKGPGAAALYGSRAANGVVLIQTKEGSSQKGIGISINSSLTIDRIAFLPEFQNVYGQGSGGQFAYEDGLGGGIGDGGLVSFGPEMNGQLITQFDGVSYTPLGQQVRGGDVIARNGNPIIASPWNSNEDNVKSFFETGVTSTQNVAFSNGNEKGSYRFSYTRMDNKGTIPNADFRRNNVAITAMYKLSERLKIRTYTNYIQSSSNHRPGLGYGSENVMYSFLWMGRQVNLENAKDYWQFGQEGFQQFNYNTQWLDNPYFNVFENTNGFVKNRLLGNAALTYEATENIQIRLRSGMDTYQDNRSSKRAFSTQRFQNGSYREDIINFTELNTDLLAMYTSTRTGLSNWNIGAGGNMFIQKTNYESFTAGQLSVPGIYNFENSKIPLSVSQFAAQKQIRSIYGVFGWKYDSRVFVDATLRNDWSTTLPLDNNSFAYYSLSSAFIISEMLQTPDWMSYAKLRLSAASVGNDTDPFQLRNTYSFNQNYGSFPLLTNASELKNSNLKPERTRGLEAGMEVYFLEDRFGIDLTVYQNNTFDQIIGLPASAASGYTNRVVNGGEIRSRGVEVSLVADWIENDKLSWNSYVNFSKGQAEVMELPEGIDQYTTGYARVYSGTDNTVFYIANPDGGRIGDMYGTGFMKTDDGQIIYDENGLPIRDSELRYLGNYNPDFILALGNTIEKGAFVLNFLFDWRQGGTIVSRTKAIGSTSGVLAETLEGRTDGIIGEGVVNVGTEEAPIYETNTTVISAADYYNQFFNRANEESATYDASYLKLRQMSLTYRIPNKLLNRWKVQDCSVGFIATNLFTITENPHFDPELSAMQGTSQVFGVEDLSYPSTRSYGVNLQIKF